LDLQKNGGVMKIFKTFKRLLCLMLMFTLYAGAEPSIRLSEHIPSHAVENAAFLNNLDGSTNIAMTFTLPLRNEKELKELIDRLYDPSDSDYGKYLTASEFIDRFAPTQEDYDNVIAYAKSVGFTVTGQHPNRTLLDVDAPAQTVELAFNLGLQQYQLPSGRQFHAPDQNPEVPVSIASTIRGIVGLDNHAEWRSFNQENKTIIAEAAPQSYPSGPRGGYAPRDIVKAYNLSGVSANGSNQVVALFELANYQVSDINAYANYFGLPSPKLKTIFVDGGSGSGIDAECTLDIQLALALAPQSEIYVYEGPNSGRGVIDTYNRIATDNIAKQISSSWGISENYVNSQYLQTENSIFKQMAAQGQTVYIASGDRGAYDNGGGALQVLDPAAQPYCSGVGGTRLLVDSNTGAYRSESVWNHGSGSASGGGVSRFWSIPSWQTNVPTVYSKTNRNVPDVSLNSDPGTGYAIYYRGGWSIYGGTSCAAPLWAAFTACVNQTLTANQQPTLGFANPKFYAIGSSAAYAADFYDVTVGNNLYYNAHSGYDNATGWGSFNGTGLYDSLTNFTAAPTLDFIMKHNAPFTKGGIGSYRIVISNTGTISTSGPMTVSVTLPTGLSYNSYSGQGWVMNQNTLTFTQNDILKPGIRFPTLVVNVNVAADAPQTVIPSATLSGSGIVSKTVTNLTTCH
jgi:kumamolisin